MEPRTKSISSAAIVLALVGLIVGALITGIAVRAHYETKLSNATTPSASTAAATLRANLVTLGVQHMMLTNQAVDAALDGSPDASQVGAALYSNGTDIGAAIKSVYGPSAEATFNTVWKLHLDQFVKYAVADKEGDSAAKQAALNTIQTGYTIPLAQYLAKANPKLSESALQTGLTEHVAMTAKVIDDHVQGNYAAEMSDMNMADTHISSLFSTLAEGIVSQYPSKF